ncbi:MAG: alpha/beta hydrolase fold domain-containing protein [Planctomycetota bacterium]
MTKGKRPFINYLLVILFILPALDKLHATTPAAKPLKAQLTVNWAVEDNPNLPNVLLIGDKVSTDYTLAVRQELTGKANVHRPLTSSAWPANCGHTTKGLSYLDLWLGEKKWDVIHFNWGLEDLKYVNQSGKAVPIEKGDQQVPLEKYETNLNTLVKLLGGTGAKLIWATTTPIARNDPTRIAGDEIRYNAIAAEIMQKHDIIINDLYSTTLSQPNPSIIAKQVAKTILDAIEGKQTSDAAKHVFDKAFMESVRREQHDLCRHFYEISDSVSFQDNVIYGCVNGRELKAIIVTPQKIPAKPRPAIVFVHGGGWMFGSPRQFCHQSNYLAEKYSFFAVNIEYRLSGEAKFPAALHDVKSAVRWVRSKAKELNIDPNRVAICGGSAGANLSSLVATTTGISEYEGNGRYKEFSSEVNLAILFNGEFDMWDLVKKSSLLRAMEKFLGGKPDEVPYLYDDLSSFRRAHKNCPPMLFLHGTKDHCVSHEQSVAFYNRLKELGVHAEAEIYEGKPHAWFNWEPDRTITLKRMEKFLVSQFNL